MSKKLGSQYEFESTDIRIVKIGFCPSMDSTKIEFPSYTLPINSVTPVNRSLLAICPNSFITTWWVVFTPVYCKINSENKRVRIGSHIFLLVVPNGDPLLAAEPAFHDETPTGVQAVAIVFGHALSKLPELLKDFTENTVPRPGMDAEMSARVVINLAGS